MIRFNAHASPRWRQVLLLLALLASIVASYWAQHTESDAPETAEAIVRNVPAAPVAPPNADADSEDAPLDLERLTRRELAGTDVDAFRAKSWHAPPPPPPPSSPEPPPKPEAPPLPFRFMGSTEEVGGGKAIFYLVQNNEFHAVSVGEEFAGSYRLERVERAALVIRYLPLSIDQRLPIATGE